MPWLTVWRDPELFIEYNGVKVYHAYKDDYFDQEREYWYSLYPGDDFSGRCIEFDVRDLPVPEGMNHEETIKRAIE